MYGKDRGQPLTIPGLTKLKASGEKIACLTAYDATFAEALDAAGVDVILVGDSLGMVVQGRSSTLPVTVDHMVYHCAAVARGASRPVLIGDMPFLSFRDVDRALENAGRLMAEGGMQMVKLEGGGRIADITRRLVDAGIPVCAHLGLTPQSVHQLGGYRVQGRAEEEAERIVEDARSLEDAGASLLVLECVPDALAGRITESLGIPTIGIGAGPACDGQVLVLHDLLGLGSGPKARFVRNFMADAEDIPGALSAYVSSVKEGHYPGSEESYG
ncbi:MAG: 3-methyl-2-oxobutanoate hydroxymethyltransferase [Xanthomonadales bacterium]|nr:3-methyl-2-oxobutanoate hydroxymethyltransferase [Xanthomonadales bacterium]